MKYLAPTIDLRFRNYVELQLRRHALLARGVEDGPEIAEVEDRLEEIWDRLDETQRQGVKGIGSDLNWVRRNGSAPPRGRSAETVTEAELASLADAESRRDWPAVLHYLRECAPVLSTEELARRRVAAYSGAGLGECAATCGALIESPVAEA